MPSPAKNFVLPSYEHSMPLFPGIWWPTSQQQLQCRYPSSDPRISIIPISGIFDVILSRPLSWVLSRIADHVQICSASINPLFSTCLLPGLSSSSTVKLIDQGRRSLGLCPFQRLLTRLTIMPKHETLIQWNLPSSSKSTNQSMAPTYFDSYMKCTPHGGEKKVSMF